MKRIYKNLLGVTAAMLAAGSMYASDPSITQIGFASTAPLSLSKQGTNSAATIVFTNAEGTTASSNAEVNGSVYNGSILQINSGGTVTITRPLSSNDVITNAALLCTSLSTNTDVDVAFSTFTTPDTFTAAPYSTANVTNLDNLGNEAAHITPLTAVYGDEDDTSDLYNLYGDGGMDDSPETVTSIRFTVGANEPLMLYGVLVYTAETQVGTGLQPSVAAKTPVSSKYYDLTGREVAAATKGFVIKKTIYSDGSIVGAKQQNH
jgi:hypothetical protein